MAGNNAIQVLRGTRSSRKSSSEYLLSGQPFYETDTNKLYIGNGELGNLADDTLYPIGYGYDTVISTQEEFEAWCAQLDAGTYTGASVLILNGTYSREDGRGLHLPSDLKCIEGLGKVQIDITNFEYDRNDNQAAIWYDDIPESGSIINLSVTARANKSSIDLNGFYQCRNVINCTCNCNNYFVNPPNDTGGFARSFYDCIDLINCSGTSYGGQTSGVGAVGFYSCSNLTGCVGTGKMYTGGGGTAGAGFYDCRDLVNCTGQGYAPTSSGGSLGLGFYRCRDLVNCAGAGTGYTGNGFHSCNICSNCIQYADAESSTSTWNANNSNVDPITCPGYTAVKHTYFVGSGAAQDQCITFIAVTASPLTTYADVLSYLQEVGANLYYPYPASGKILLPSSNTSGAVAGIYPDGDKIKVYSADSTPLTGNIFFPLIDLNTQTTFVSKLLSY